MMDSALEIFKEKIRLSIVRNHNPIIWLECFDFNYIVKLIEELCEKSPVFFGKKSVRIWTVADSIEKRIDNKPVEYFEEDDRGIYVKINDKPERYDINNPIHQGLTRYKSVVKSKTLEKCILHFMKKKREKLFIVRISERIFAKDKGCIVAALQDFVFQNNLKDDQEKQSILLITSSHFDVPGLEHICERLSFPLPDIRDIDKELGFINTDVFKVVTKYGSVAKLNKESDEYEIHKEGNVDVAAKCEICESTLFGVDSPLLNRNFFSVIEDQNGKKLVKINRDKGLICRDKNGKIKAVVAPHVDQSELIDKFPYPLAIDFGILYDGKLQNNTFIRQYEEFTDSLCGMHLYDIKELLHGLKAESKYNLIEWTLEDELLTRRITERKKQLVKNTGLLEIIDVDTDHHEKVADIKALKEYIYKQKKRIMNISKFPSKFPKPKGILLVGAPGCGKSESSKAVASILELPLYRLDIGRLLGHKYGQSENKFMEALSTADASAPCVLWIDEIEKAFAGAGNESENDDTLTHIVGHFLTWMQEHRTMVYLVATANDLSRMKPEMLRKGRWDELFKLTFPSKNGCKRIIYALLEKKFGISLIYEGEKVFVEKKKDPVGEIIDVIENDKQKKEIVIRNSSAMQYDNLTKSISSLPMSGAEIENLIIEFFIESYTTEKQLDNLIDDNTYKKIDLEKFGEYVAHYIETKKQGTQNLEISKSLSDEKFGEMDYFLRQKVYADLIDKRIANFGKEIETEGKLVELLCSKYKDMFNFKSASGE